jgi:hypothetical protein
MDGKKSLAPIESRGRILLSIKADPDGPSGVALLGDDRQ